MGEDVDSEHLKKDGSLYALRVNLGKKHLHQTSIEIDGILDELECIVVEVVERMVKSKLVIPEIQNCFINSFAKDMLYLDVDNSSVVVC